MSRYTNNFKDAKWLMSSKVDFFTGTIVMETFRHTTYSNKLQYTKHLIMIILTVVT